jgi:ABC-type polysaccharide/polyol phosphate transport system ATPase subunit
VIPAVTLQGVTKRFRLSRARRRPAYADLLGWTRGRAPLPMVTALDDVTLAVEQGEILGIVGPNAAGKSTLLRVIAGILRADRGTVAAKGGVHCLFGAKPGIGPALSVLDNARIFAAMQGMGFRETNACLDEVLAFAGLTDQRHARLEVLSFGMTERLFFGVMLQALRLGTAETFLFDEWLAGVDHQFREASEAALLREQKRGRTLVIASHDLPRLRRLCHRVAHLGAGRLLALGPPDAVLDAYLARGDHGE